MSDRDDTAKSLPSDGGLRSPNRRLILGGIPAAVTLDDVSALARWRRGAIHAVLQSGRPDRDRPSRDELQPARRAGFRTLKRNPGKKSGCYRFAYGDLNETASAFDALAAAA